MLQASIWVLLWSTVLLCGIMTLVATTHTDERVGFPFGHEQITSAYDALTQHASLVTKKEFSVVFDISQYDFLMFNVRKRSGCDACGHFELLNYLCVCEFSLIPSKTLGLQYT